MFGKIYVKKNSLCLKVEKGLAASSEKGSFPGSPTGYPARKVYVYVVFSPARGWKALGLPARTDTGLT